MNILPITEKLSGPGQLGGWQDMARRRYQKGTIRKRGKRNPIWELQWRVDYIKPDGSIGRKRESVILGPASEMTRRQAFKAAEEHLRPLNSGKTTPHASLTYADFVEQFFVPNAFPILKLSTRKRYRLTFNNHLLPAFGKSRLSDIRTLQIQKFVLEKMDSGLGWESADLFRNLLSKTFTMARKWGYFAGDNPATDVELPEKIPVREKRVLQPEQIRQLLQQTEEPYRTMILTGVHTGLRIGEILGLRWQDVDFGQRKLTVAQAIYRGTVGTPKTKGSKRSVPLSERLLAALASHYSRSKKKDGPQLVFQTRKGTAFGDTNLLHRVLKPAGRLIGAPWMSWHTLRRTHATLLQLAGGSIKDAQAQLGHTKLSTTLEVYTIPLPQHQRDSVEKLSDLVTNGDEIAEVATVPAALSQRIQ